MLSKPLEQFFFIKIWLATLWNSKTHSEFIKAPCFCFRAFLVSSFLGVFVRNGVDFQKTFSCIYFLRGLLLELCQVSTTSHFVGLFFDIIIFNIPYLIFPKFLTSKYVQSSKIRYACNPFPQWFFEY